MTESQHTGAAKTAVVLLELLAMWEEEDAAMGPHPLYSHAQLDERVAMLKLAGPDLKVVLRAFLESPRVAAAQEHRFRDLVLGRRQPRAR